MMPIDWTLALADEWATTPTGAPWPHLHPALGEAARLLVQGRTGAAMRTAAKARDAARATRDGELGLLALSLGWLAEVRHFNLLPGGCGTGALDVATRWQGVERAQAMITDAAEWRDMPGVAAARPLRRWLEFAAGRPMAGATVRDAHGTPFLATVTQLHVRQCEMALDDARGLAPPSEAFVARCTAELLRRSGQSEPADQALAHATALGLPGGPGLAACRALACDWQIAPYSSALVRNLEINEAAYPTSELAWPVEAAEGAADVVDIAAAAASLDDAEACAREAGADRVLGWLALCRAQLERLRGDPVRQRVEAEAAVVLFEASGDELHAQLARSHVLLARIDTGAPEDPDAAAAIGRWGATDGSFSYTLGLGLMFTRAARQSLLRQGDYERAQSALQLALALNRALGAPFREAQTWADLAALGRAIGDRTLARSLQGRALDTLVALAGQAGPARGAASMRLALLAQESYAEAVDHRDAAGMRAAIDRATAPDAPGDDVAVMAVDQFMQSTRAQANVLIPLYRGVDARNNGDVTSADTLFDAALAAARSLPGADGDLLGGIVLATMRRRDEAVAAYERYTSAGAQRAGPMGDVMVALQAVGGERGAQEQAKALARAAEERFAFMVRCRDYRRAEAALATLVALAGDAWYRDDPRPWRALADIGEMHEGLGQLDAALARYAAAIDTLEQRRALLSRDDLKTALSADFGAQYLYFQAVRTALKQTLAAGDETARARAAAAAFSISEQARARALLDLMASRRRLAGIDEPPALRRWREAAARAQVLRGLLARARQAADAERGAVLAQRAQDADDALRAARAALVDERPELVSLVGQEAEPITLDRARARLPEGSALLQYMTLGDELLLWGVTRRGLEAPTVVSLRAAELAHRTRQFQRACAGAAPLPELLVQADALSQELLAPLRAVIEAHTRLVVVPYGELFELPFGALRWRGRWLADSHRLTQLPSASMLELLGCRDAPPGRSVLAVGGPDAMAYTSLDGERRELDALPGAQDEARHVAQVLGGCALVGPSATKRAVLDALGAHPILHFATHGAAFEEAPLMSGVALAQGEWLSVHELLACRLQAELVTLSACDTARGVLTGGQELIGLTRGLLAAGARRVVVSLWPVGDGTTAVLMSRFADALAAGREAVTALHEAQAAMRRLDTAALAEAREALRELEIDGPPVALRAGEHPQRWAAFLMVGI